MRVLVIHNRYQSRSPSGENAVVDAERVLLCAAGLDVRAFEVESDSIAVKSLARRAAVPVGVVWSCRGVLDVRAAVRAHRPDVVHFHNTFPLLSPAAIRAASSEGVATVQTFHNFRPFCPSSTGLLRDGRLCRDCVGRLPLPAIQHGCYRGSRVATVPIALMDAVHQRLGTWTQHLDRLIFPSEFAQAEYVRAGWPEGRMVVKYNTAPRRPPIEPEGRRGIACVARMRAEKGIDLLLQAWRSVSETREEDLTLAGGGEELAAYKAEAVGIRGVRFVGQRSSDEVSELLGHAQALVVPSRVSEVFPRIVLEAYAVGTPVIAARRGSLPDVVEHGVTGLLVEPESSSDLARVLLEALADPDSLVRMGRAANARYERLYSPEATTARLIEIYAEAIRHRAGSDALTARANRR